MTDWTYTSPLLHCHLLETLLKKRRCRFRLGDNGRGAIGDRSSALRASYMFYNLQLNGDTWPAGLVI